MASELQWDIVQLYSLQIDPSVGSGRFKSMRLNSGLTLTVMDCHLHKPTTIQFAVPFEAIAFGFTLSGNMEARPKGIKEPLVFRTGLSNFNWFPCVGTSTETLGAGQLQRVCITMDYDQLRTITGDRVRSLPGALDNTPKGYLFRTGAVTPAMRSAVLQILQCPFRGVSRDVFIEAKVLELLAYKFESFGVSAGFDDSATLPKTEVELVRYAAHLLTADLENPPGLEMIARTVGMCRTKIHKAFHTVYGETPFAYQRRHRLETAKRYLLEGRMNVTEAAFAVGYSSSGYFTKAFKQYYGDLPGKYCFRASSSKNGR